MKFTIGTDPEFFIKNDKTGKLVSAIPHIEGDKHNPIPLPSGGNIQSDNVAVEFSTIPAKSPEDFVEKLRSTLKDTLNCLPKGHSLLVSPSAIFPEEELQDEKAKEFGCTPDYCAWKLCENKVPSHPDHKFRSCGGHIHVGAIDANGNPLHKDSEFLLTDMGKVWMVRGMDLFHGIISTILDNSKEAVERRILYGKAGCHRPTVYGVEYRTLSAWWTKHPMSSMLMAALVDDVITVIANDRLDDLIKQVGPENICDIINTGNVAKAKEILDSVLIGHLSEDSRFFLSECIAKMSKDDTLSAEWGV